MKWFNKVKNKIEVETSKRETQKEMKFKESESRFRYLQSLPSQKIQLNSPIKKKKMYMKDFTMYVIPLDFEVICDEKQLKEVYTSIILESKSMDKEEYSGIKKMNESQGEVIYQYSNYSADIVFEFDKNDIFLTLENFRFAKLKNDNLLEFKRILKRYPVSQFSRIFLNGGSWMKYDFLESKTDKGKDDYSFSLSPVKVVDLEDYNLFKSIQGANEIIEPWEFNFDDKNDHMLIIK